MSKIFVCGDTHGDYDFSKLNSKNFPEYKTMTKNDYVIIVGDWGGIWDCGGSDRYVQNWYNQKPWTTLWVDGNHENFDAIAQYPVTEWHGGKVHMISDSIIHLMRGQVYEIGGKTFFTMGGADSIDKISRKERYTWWPQEMPTNQEYEEGFINLERYDNKVDYILTHCAPDSWVDMFSGGAYRHDKLTNYLQVIFQTVEYRDWFFGHYHVDGDYDYGMHCLYNTVRPII